MTIKREQNAHARDRDLRHQNSCHLAIETQTTNPLRVVLRLASL